MITAVAVAIDYLTGEHVDEFHPGMLKAGVGNGFPRQRDKERLNDQIAAVGVSKQLVSVPDLCATSVDNDTLVRSNEGTTTLFFKSGEQNGNWNIQRFS